MKKYIFILLLLCLLALLTQAQVYVKAFTGYAFSSNPATIQSTEIINNVENVYVSKFKNGQGNTLGFALGYNYTSNLSFEITGNTQIFTAYKIFIPQKDISNSNNFSLSGYFGNIKYVNNIFQFAPQIIYTIDYNKNLRFFIKTGPDFLIVKTRYQYNYISWSFDSSFSLKPNQIAENIKQKGRLNIGFNRHWVLNTGAQKKYIFFVNYFQ